MLFTFHFYYLIFNPVLKHWNCWSLCKQTMYYLQLRFHRFLSMLIVAAKIPSHLQSGHRLRWSCHN